MERYMAEQTVFSLNELSCWLDKEFCLFAVDDNGLYLDNVQYQTEDICLKAVWQNVHALRFIKHQTETICMKAV